MGGGGDLDLGASHAVDDLCLGALLSRAAEPGLADEDVVGSMGMLPSIIGIGIIGIIGMLGIPGEEAGVGMADEGAYCMYAW